MPGLDDDELPSLALLDRKPVEGMLDVAKSKWTEDQMKMYQRGLDDNTTVVTFSMKVYYTIEVKNMDIYKYIYKIECVVVQLAAIESQRESGREP